MKNLKTFEEYQDDYVDVYDTDILYDNIKRYISNQYGIDGVSDSDIDEWMEVLKERGEDPTKMNYEEIADSMYDDFEERVEKDWDENP